MKKILLMFILMISSLYATTYTLIPGWNLLGTKYSIPASDILKNPEVRNIVIYQDGAYASSAANEFTTIPADSGFFVYTDSSISVEISDTVTPSITLQKLDGNFNETTEESWKILKIVDANLLIEMKNNTYNAGLFYTWSEAASYCQNLTIGSVSDWRLPTKVEMNALIDIYATYESDFIIRSSSTPYYTSHEYSVDLVHYTRFDGGAGATAKEGQIMYAICVKSL